MTGFESNREPLSIGARRLPYLQRLSLPGLCDTGVLGWHPLSPPYDGAWWRVCQTSGSMDSAPHTNPGFQDAVFSFVHCLATSGGGVLLHNPRPTLGAIGDEPNCKSGSDVSPVRAGVPYTCTNVKRFGFGSRKR